MKPLSFLIILCGLSSILLAEEGFRSLFNGRDLTGWEGSPDHWTVENGVVIGTCTGPDDLDHNTFLIWRDGTVQDFELRATVRIVGDNNSGIQYRSRERIDIGPWVISGYQCDIHPAIEHTGMTYEEKGRGIFGLNGKNVILDDHANRWLESEHPPVQIDVTDWNEYTIIARGNRLIHKVNGQTTSGFIDHDKKGRALEGLLAIQLHRGNPNRVEIKNLQIRKLKDGEIFPLDPFELAKIARKIEKPRSVNPQGTGPIQRPFN